MDKANKPLPGATVTLSGPHLANLTTVSSDSGVFRFPAVHPGQNYALKAELAGFKTANRGNIIDTVGGNAEIELTLEAGKPEEQVTVTAVTPIVDAG